MAAPRPVPTVPPVTTLHIPSPEELGVAAVGPAARPNIDWTAVHERLDRLGATCFHKETLAEGGCRITCLLPTGEANRHHRIEAQADSEAEAIRLTLAKADEWANSR
jgi:hypothetical protein